MSVADDLVFFFGEEHNLKILDDLEKELTIEAVEAPATTDSPVAGKPVVFAGTLATRPRRQATARARPLGAKRAGAFCRTPDCVMTGADAGATQTAADEVGITTIPTTTAVDK